MPIRPLLPHFFQAKTTEFPALYGVPTSLGPSPRREPTPSMIKKLTLSVVLLTMLILTSNSANAGYFSDNSHVDANMDFLRNTMNKNTSIEDIQEQTSVATPAPKAKTIKTASKVNPLATLMVIASAYSSTPHQTDDSPFITANGEHVYWGGVAANILDTNNRNIPFGTKLMIPDLFGDQIFTVNDRMNRRYKNNLDVWFSDTADAREFGRKTIKIVIVSKN